MEKEKQERKVTNLWEFGQWFWDRYFEHIEKIEIIAAKNWKNLCLDKLADFERRLSINGITAILLCLLLTGCVTMRYQDGNKSVEYTSIGRTAQNIQGDLNKGTVQVEGQKIDAKFITAVTEFLKAIQ